MKRTGAKSKNGWARIEPSHRIWHVDELDLKAEPFPQVLEGPLYRSPVFPEIQVDLAVFWREVDEELALA